MIFADIYEFLYNLSGTLILFGEGIILFMTQEISFGDTFSVPIYVVLFGSAFTAWILWKALPVT